MAWYYGTFACGHEGRVDIIGPMKHREFKAKRAFEGLCGDCYQMAKEQERERERQEAARKAAEMELPALTGTPKQISFGEVCRQKAIEKVEKIFAPDVDKMSRKYAQYMIELLELDEEKIRKATDYMIKTKTSAAWWIEKSRENIFELLVDQYKQSQKDANSPITADEKKELEFEATVRPEDPKTETVAQITFSDDTLQVIFPERREDFRLLMRDQLNMRWSGSCWERKLNNRNGTPEDRVAEAGHRLLAAGFVIRIMDSEIRRKAIEGKYEPEHTRWIVRFTSGENDGKLGILWDRRHEDFYKVSRRLPGSRWSNPYVVVGAEHFEEVLDFAERYDFKLSEGAQQTVEQARKERERTLVANVPEPEEKQKVEADTKPPTLNVPEDVNIDEELRDDN